MSKYLKLWEFIQEKNLDEIILDYDEIKNIIGFSIDHSFLKYKKELLEYGYEVKKISMKDKKIIFSKIK